MADRPRRRAKDVPPRYTPEAWHLPSGGRYPLPHTPKWNVGMTLFVAFAFLNAAVWTMLGSARGTPKGYVVGWIVVAVLLLVLAARYRRRRIEDGRWNEYAGSLRDARRLRADALGRPVSSRRRTRSSAEQAPTPPREPRRG